MTPDPENEPPLVDPHDAQAGPENDGEAGADEAGEGREGARRGRPDADPLRTCVATGEPMAQSRLLRFARSPDGVAVPDVRERLPGRGVWVRCDREALRLAVKKNAFSRGFRQPTTPMADLESVMEGLLLRQLQDTLGLARKSGQVVAGADQVAEEIRRRAPGWLLEASDGAADGRGKLMRLAEGLWGEVRVAGALSGAELGMALGREHVVHALVRRGRFAKLWARAYARLCGFRERPEETWLLQRQR